MPQGPQPTLQQSNNSNLKPNTIYYQPHLLNCKLHGQGTFKSSSHVAEVNVTVNEIMMSNSLVLVLQCNLCILCYVSSEFVVEVSYMQDPTYGSASVILWVVVHLRCTVVLRPQNFSVERFCLAFVQVSDLVLAGVVSASCRDNSQILGIVLLNHVFRALSKL